MVFTPALAAKPTRPEASLGSIGAEGDGCGGRPCIVVDNHGKELGAVVLERGVEVDGSPVVSCEGGVGGAAIHLVGFGRMDPVGRCCAVESGLFGVDEVDVELAGSGVCGVTVVEGEAADSAGLAYFAGAVDLFCERIVIRSIEWNIGAACGGGAAAEGDIGAGGHRL